MPPVVIFMVVIVVLGLHGNRSGADGCHCRSPFADRGKADTCVSSTARYRWERA